MAFVEWMDAVSEFGQLPALTRQSRRTLFLRKLPLLHALLTLARVALLSGALPCTKGR